MKTDLVSIIVPVYNVEHYISRCVDSLLNQTYRNIEIILVDDGSTDSSSLICDQYAKKDQRIQVFHKKNGGLSDARNVGITYSKGDFITFVDSDDFVTKDYIEYMYRLLQENHADISIVSNKKVWNENEKIECTKFKKEIFDNIEAMEDMFYQKHIENSAWAKLYRRELFEEIEFPKGKLYEDLGTTYKVFFKSRIIVWCNQQKYYYFQRNNSIMSRTFSTENRDRIDISKEIVDFTRVNAPSILDAAISRFFISNIQLLREIPLSEIQYQSLFLEICQNIKCCRKKILFDKKAKMINRLIAFCTYMPLSIIQKMGVIYKKVYK